jgi:amino acid transporter
MHVPSEEPLLRQLTVFGIWVIAVNGLIGAGIFGTPAEVARLMGGYGPLLFLGCGILMMAVILSFAEVASYFRNTGGPILYTRTVYGRFAGFQAGWAFYIARITAFAANTNLLVSTMGYFWEDASVGFTRILMLAIICALLAWVNVVGTKRAINAMSWLTVLKFIPLFLLVGVGLWTAAGASSGWMPAEMTLPGYTDIGTATLLVIYAFVGWEAAVIPAGETRNPARDIPRALIAAMLTVTVLYIAIQYVSTLVMPDLAESSRPLVEVAAVLMGPAGAVLLTLGVIVSVGGNIAGTYFTTPRLSYAMAREGTLPAWFGKIHPEYRTPANSILFFTVVCFLLAVYGSFVWLAALSALVRILIYVASISTIPVLRKRNAGRTDVFRLPGGLTIPALAIIICMWLMSSVSFTSVAVTLGFLAVGTVLYASVGRDRGASDEKV